MKKNIVVTGGAGFVGTNLIKYFLNKTNFNLISIDDYSSGTYLNHQKSKRVKYYKGNTKDIDKILKNPRKIHSIFHFGEFSRIYQSFLQMEKCLESNSVGTNSVFSYCLSNNIKLIYSATSASLGNKGKDKDLSPYAFTKAKNLELLENLKKWFNFKFEIIYFYNVYGKRQIQVGEMATVIGIFQNQFKNKMPLTVVKPGTQTRRFTHVLDTVKICYQAWSANKCTYYSISNKKSYSVLDVAKMFKTRISYLKPRLGERYASALTNFSFNKRVIKKFGKISLKDYVASFIKEKN